MRVWDKNTGCDIRVYLPGPPGPPRVDVGYVTEPVVITSSIAAPVFPWQRSFISAVSSVNQPTIPNPANNGQWILDLQIAPGSAPITLNNASNIKLSGQWIGNPDSIIRLEWDGNSRYVEGGRNEI